MNAWPKGGDEPSYHLWIGDPTANPVVPGTRDVEVDRLRIRFDGPLAGHPHLDELTAELAAVLSADARAGTSLHLEVDDDALRGVSVRDGLRVTAAEPGAAAAAVERLRAWLAVRGPVPPASPGDDGGSAAE